MITVDQIKYMLQQLTLSRVSLDFFEEWLTGASWNMHKDSELGAVKMVGQIERLLAEQDAGYRSQAEVLREFRELAGLFEMSNHDVSSRVTTSSTGAPTPLDVPFQLWEVFDKQLVPGFSYIPHLQGAR